MEREAQGNWRYARFAGRRRHRRRVQTAIGILTGLAVLIAAGVVFGGRILAAATRIRSVEIALSGPGVLTEAEVRQAIAIDHGSSLYRLDGAQLREQLMALPRVAAVHWTYRWFQRLYVSVDERVAIAMIITPDGRILEVATDGVLLAPAGAAAADLPLLTWEGWRLAAEAAPGTLLDLPGGPDLAELLRRLQTDQPNLWRDVSEAHLLTDGTYELYWNDIPTVVWGRGRMSGMRLRAWATVMNDLRDRGETDAVIDLRFRDQVVVRLPSSARPAERKLG